MCNPIHLTQNKYLLWFEPIMARIIYTQQEVHMIEHGHIYDYKNHASTRAHKKSDKQTTQRLQEKTGENKALYL